MSISLIQVRENLAETVNRVQYGGERIALTRHGKKVAAIVSMEDLALLEKMEDEMDVKAARKVLQNIKTGKEKLIPWEDVKVQLRRAGKIK